MTNRVIINKNKLLAEICLNQRKTVEKKYLLELNDIIRLLKNIDGSIFNKTECVLWNGYLTKCNNDKSYYVNFYLKKKKLALHRILYINFVGDLNTKNYLKFTCNNPGKCCNINHITKVCMNDNTTNIVIPIIQQPVIKNNISDIKITKVNSSTEVGKIVIIFDD
jgi:hypothetical protein